MSNMSRERLGSKVKGVVKSLSDNKAPSSDTKDDGSKTRASLNDLRVKNQGRGASSPAGKPGRAQEIIKKRRT